MFNENNTIKSESVHHTVYDCLGNCAHKYREGAKLVREGLNNRVELDK